VTSFDEEKKSSDRYASDHRKSFGLKAPKPVKSAQADSDEGSWVSSPPVDWSTRPVGSRDEDEEVALERPRRGLFSILLRDIVIPLLIAVGLVFGGLATIAKPYQIPTGSMEPTIQVNDRILANRVIYHFKDIERGDVIVFDPPEAPGVEAGTPYVKRVVGLPGDTVAVEDGKTFVNSEEFVVDQVLEPPYYTYKEQTVPEGMLFVLGDNRNSSLDSHRWGFLPIDNVIGRADFIYWPMDSLDWMG
jgi:signal peptidase I